MADRGMYFGTRERMTWIKSPNSGMGRTRSGWSASGTYLNGGGWSRESGTKHFEPSLTWSFMDHRQVRDIEDYYLGAYGPGPFYWVDPFAHTTNVLPAHWSVPRLAADDAPPLIRGQRPSLSDTPENTIGLPTKMATYELSLGDDHHEVWVPVPPGFAAHVAVWGVSSGTAAVVGTTADDGMIDTVLTSPASSFTLWRTYTSDVTISTFGNGTLTLAGMLVQVLPTGVSPSSGQRFLSGAGHSGCAFKSAPTVTGYSSPQAIDYQSVTADFIEVGAWLQ